MVALQQAISREVSFLMRRSAAEHSLLKDISVWLGTGSNRRPHDFQSHARTN